MSRFARVLGFGSVLLLGLVFLAGGYATGADDDDKKAIKEAQKDILDLVKAIEGGSKDVPAKVKAIKKKFEDLGPIMHAYKPSTKGGIGFEAGAKGAGDGLESKLLGMAKRNLSADALAKEKAALIKLAYVNMAIAEIARS